MKTQIPRIALFLPSLHGGGAERVMVNLANGFARRGLRVDLVLAKAEGPYLPLVRPEVRVIDLRSGRVLLAISGLVRYLRRHRPTALISAMGHANVAAYLSQVLFARETKVIATVHTPPYQAAIETRSLKQRVVLLTEALTYRQLNAVVAVSEEVKRELRDRLCVPNESLKVIPNAVLEPDVFDRAKEGVDHPWLRERRYPVILSAGRLAKEKDYRTLLRAFARVAATRPARLIVLGDGEERSNLVSLASELGVGEWVDFPGYVSNPYAYMARCDVFVLTSRREGMPSVLVEALALGAPIVATAAGGGIADLLDDGLYGKLVPVGDDEAVATAIIDALSEGRSTRDCEVWQRYLTERSVDEYLKIMEVTS